jgi:hypothetical protein
LLDTTRSYALEKLAASGEHNSIAARHASHLSQSLENSRGNLFDLEPGQSLADAIQHYVGDIRAALEWSFGPDGNDGAAIRMAAAASQLFLAKSLFMECRDWMGRAIDRIAANDDPRDQMEIHASFALSLMFTAGDSERVRNAFNTALMLAERCEEAATASQRTIDASSSYDRRGGQS